MSAKTIEVLPDHLALFEIYIQNKEKVIEYLKFLNIHVTPEMSDSDIWYILTITYPLYSLRKFLDDKNGQ